MNVHAKFETFLTLQCRDIDKNVNLVKIYSLAL